MEIAESMYKLGEALEKCAESVGRADRAKENASKFMQTDADVQIKAGHTSIASFHLDRVDTIEFLKWYIDRENMKARYTRQDISRWANRLYKEHIEAIDNIQQ